ncbi:MAG: biotin--[acetyl-CoA-carboxylase] ligase [Candidatus Rokubacteria bacterium]|nr:biotin--[acetyl-CoA-carboxylase] ligase [Candidatus Rokubacteria bacterium]
MASRCVPDVGRSLEAPLSIETIRRGLVTERIGVQTYLFGEVGSTNAVLRHLAQTGAADGTVVLAETQTVGRGRLGKPWFSPPALNVYASVLLRPPIAPSAVPAFAMIASLAVADAVWAEGLPASVKWPNDVLVARRKVAGTLVGYAIEGDRTQYVILGVGVNLNVDRAMLVTGLGAAATDAGSLREAAGHPIDRNAFAARLLNALEKWDDAYRARGPAPVLEAWRQRDGLAGHLVRLREPHREWLARAIGVSADGRLLVQNDSDAPCEVTDAEVVFAD